MAAQKKNEPVIPDRGDKAAGSTGGSRSEAEEPGPEQAVSSGDNAYEEEAWPEEVDWEPDPADLPPESPAEKEFPLAQAPVAGSGEAGTRNLSEEDLQLLQKRLSQEALEFLRGELRGEWRQVRTRSGREEF